MTHRKSSHGVPKQPGCSKNLGNSLQRLTPSAWNARHFLVISFVLLALLQPARAQLWASLLTSSQAIDWSHAGVGPIPLRAAACARLTPAATVAAINSALASCPPGKTVYLSPGTYSISATIHIPSMVTLRGAGADQTILNATGQGDTVVSLGNGWASYQPLRIASGATAGSTRIMLEKAAGIVPGMYLAVAENNDPRFVTAAGSQALCTQCDGGWTPVGRLARGQIVEVTGVFGDVVTFAPGLYSAYTLSPVAVPFSMGAQYAGVEDLQVYANNTGYGANFYLQACAYCWVKGVESNYADGDHVSIEWGFRDEIRDSYFSNAYLHEPGTHDSDIRLALKTTATLVENNIVERTHQSVLLQYGAAGNVVAYNYTTGEFDSGAIRYMVGGVFLHGAHPQFNLVEGNVITKLDQDSTWGSSSHTTAFRNWIVGTNRICAPLKGRAPVNCSGPNGRYGYQAARAVQLSYVATRNNFVANLVGSAQMQSLTNSGRPLAQVPSIEYPARRSYEGAAYAWSFGYGMESDDGSGTGCSGGTPPCHLPATSSTDFFDGNYNQVTGAIAWSTGTPHPLPASFFLSAKPAWWGNLPFPAIGPDVRGGSGPGEHSFGNPAQNCYNRVMGGIDGGAASPLRFNREACYGTAVQPR
jgi:hypothetical protein